VDVHDLVHPQLTVLNRVHAQSARSIGTSTPGPTNQQSSTMGTGLLSILLLLTAGYFVSFCHFHFVGDVGEPYTMAKKTPDIF
jgi:hypothetical protein